jgi:hypothetical protein
MKTYLPMLTVLALAVAAIALSLNCSTAMVRVCVPGETQACTCTGEDTGVQSCAEDASYWMDCECSDGDDDDSAAADDDDDTGQPDDCPGVAELFDFEDGEQGWAHGIIDAGFDDPWELGTPDEEDCASGEACWATELGGEYGDCEAGVVVSPVMNLSACEDTEHAVTLAFQHLFRFEYSASAYYDGGMVQISRDAGDSWEDVDPEPAYSGEIEGNYSDCSGDATVGGEDGWGNYIESNDWEEVTVEIPERFFVEEFKIRFVFGSDRGVTDEGWYVDDIEIRVE